MSTPYDQVPYPCNAYAQTHPGHLAAIARLQGLSPVAPEKCRYLEIGCGDGGNLLPLAYALPASHFFGIDLAASSIDSACKHSREFGLSNIEFRTLDIMDLTQADLGSWDYIVAHGVFSWVPEAVRLRLLDLCRELLAPQGVAFISYNAYPGFHIRNMAREMLLYHTENAPDPASKISQGRALMKFLAENHGTDDEYGTLFCAEATRVLQYRANHFYHDDLADLNQAFYLHQFADLAAAHGLQYLGDADFASMHATRYPPEVRKVLAELGDDFIRKEQYLDFLKCRRFRQTLLCHPEIQLNHTTPPVLMREFYFASSAKPSASAAQLLDNSPIEFQGEGGLKGETSAPIAKVTLAYLGQQWPDRIPFSDLETSVTTTLGSAPAPEALETVLRELLHMGAAEAHVSPAPFTTHISERPSASAWALYQLRFGGGITTLRHQTIHIRDAFGLWLLGQLDGTKTLEEIAHTMASTVKPDAEGHLDFHKELTEAQALVKEGIENIASWGLLSA